MSEDNPPTNGKSQDGIGDGGTQNMPLGMIRHGTGGLPVSIVDPNAAYDIFRVGVRSSPFWPEKPVLWFAQMEAQFALSNITADSTKFYYVIGQLDSRYSSEVEDIIASPPATNKYEKLKTELIKRLSASREKKVKQLLMHEELGDRKPSQFLRHLLNLAGPGVPEEFVRTIWVSRLPSNLQPIIVSQGSSTLEKLAELADQVHEIVPASPQVASTSAGASSSAMDEMARQIAALTKQVRVLSSQNSRSRSRTRGNGRERRRGRSHSRTRSDSSYRKYPTCWYHSKFGSKADICQKPCDYTPSSGNFQGGR